MNLSERGIMTDKEWNWQRLQLTEEEKAAAKIEMILISNQLTQLTRENDQE